MGFPSPARDYQENAIDLSAFLVEHQAATFFFRVKGDSMVNAHIPDGCLLIVDRSVTAVSGKIVVAVVDGEFTVRRLVRNSRSVILHPENPVYKPTVISPEMDMQVWGVVTGIVIKPVN